MSKKIKASVSDDEFTKAMNYGNTKSSDTKNNANTNANTNANKTEKTINSVLNDNEDINMSSLNINALRKLKEDSNNMLNKNENDPLNNRIKDTIKTTRSKLKKTTDNIKSKSSSTLDRIVGRIKETPEQKKDRLIKKQIVKKERRERRILRKKEGKTNIGSIIQILLILLVIMALSYGVYYYFNNVLNDSISGIQLIEGVKDGKQPLVIAQDQNNPNFIPIVKSFDLEGGAQFTYSFWFAINDMEYKKGEWKDMWYKGDKYRLSKSPGVFIHENSNKIRIEMSVIKKDAKTVEDMTEYVDVDNIPIGVWINMVMVFTEDKISINPDNKQKRYRNCLDIYINGLLKTRKELSSVPLFNTGDVWINMNGGFGGVLGNLEYYPRALEPTEVHKILKTCPGESQCGKTLDCPPYLSNKWWFD